jgi:hypothetical protein
LGVHTCALHDGAAGSQYWLDVHVSETVLVVPSEVHVITRLPLHESAPGVQMTSRQALRAQTCPVSVQSVPPGSVPDPSELQTFRICPTQVLRPGVQTRSLHATFAGSQYSRPLHVVETRVLVPSAEHVRISFPLQKREFGVQRTGAQVAVVRLQTSPVVAQSTPGIHAEPSAAHCEGTEPMHAWTFGVQTRAGQVPVAASQY